MRVIVPCLRRLSVSLYEIDLAPIRVFDVKCADWASVHLRGQLLRRHASKLNGMILLLGDVLQWGAHAEDLPGSIRLDNGG